MYSGHTSAPVLTQTEQVFPTWPEKNAGWESNSAYKNIEVFAAVSKTVYGSVDQIV